MKRLLVLSVLLFLSVSTIATAGIRPARKPDSMQVFWQNFKKSVSAGKKQAVAGLTKFPLELSYGVPVIRNRSEFLRRYREVFNVQADAVQCFAKAKPEIDAAKPKEFTKNPENAPLLGVGMNQSSRLGFQRGAASLWSRVG